MLAKMTNGQAGAGGGSGVGADGRARSSGSRDVPLESEITRKIQRYLASVDGWWGFKVLGGGAQMRGVPDIVGCYRGRFVALEVKRPAGLGVVSELQRLRLRQIGEAGGLAVVVYGVEDVRQVIAQLAEVCV